MDSLDSSARYRAGKHTGLKVTVSRESSLSVHRGEQGTGTSLGSRLEAPQAGWIPACRKLRQAGSLPHGFLSRQSSVYHFTSQQGIASTLDGLFSAMTRPRGPFCQVEWTTLHIGRRIGGIIPGKTAPQREFRPLQGEDAAQKKRFAQKTKKIRVDRKKRLSMLIRWRAKELGQLVSHSRTENGTVLEMVRRENGGRLSMEGTGNGSEEKVVQSQYGPPQSFSRRCFCGPG